MAGDSDGAKCRLWRERFERFDDGGVSVAEYCGAEGVSQSSFYHWRRKLAPSKRPPSPSRQPTKKMAGHSVFEPVTIATAAMVVIRLPNGTLIEVPAHSEQALRAIVGQLVPADVETERC